MVSGLISSFCLDEYLSFLWIFAIHPSWQAHNENQGVRNLLLDSLKELQFILRQKYLGRFALRKGLPKTSHPKFLLQERKYYELALSRVIPRALAQEIGQCVDIGCRNWSYAKALSDYFPLAKLSGVEVDGARRYWNLFRRIDMARAYASELREEGREVEVFGKDFRELHSLRQPLKRHEKVVFCFFFPFVSENPCIRWGLPSRFANFTELLEHSKTLVRSFDLDPIWMSAHQGEWEAAEARKAYQSSKISYKETVLKVEEFIGLWPSSYDTHLFFADASSTHLKELLTH